MALQAAIALYEACGYQKTSLETALNDTPMAGGSLLGDYIASKSE